MGRRPKQSDDMEIEAIKGQLTTLNKRMDEVVTLLAGNSSYGVKGIRTELNEVKKEVREIRLDVDGMKREKGVISIKLESLPSRVMGFIVFFGILITMIKELTELFGPQQ